MWQRNFEPLTFESNHDHRQTEISKQRHSVCNKGTVIVQKLQHFLSLDACSQTTGSEKSDQSSLSQYVRNNSDPFPSYSMVNVYSQTHTQEATSIDIAKLRIGVWPRMYHNIIHESEVLNFGREGKFLLPSSKLNSLYEISIFFNNFYMQSESEV